MRLVWYAIAPNSHETDINGWPSKACHADSVVEANIKLKMLTQPFFGRSRRGPSWLQLHAIQTHTLALPTCHPKYLDYRDDNERVIKIVVVLTRDGYMSKGWSTRPQLTQDALSRYYIEPRTLNTSPHNMSLKRSNTTSPAPERSNTAHAKPLLAAHIVWWTRQLTDLGSLIDMTTWSISNPLVPGALGDCFSPAWLYYPFECPL